MKWDKKKEDISKVFTDKLILPLFWFVLGHYTAPELYRNEIFDASVDAFSFGFILYEVSDIHTLVSEHDTLFWWAISVRRLVILMRINSLWYTQMVEGTHTVHGKSSEESGHTIRYDGMRPSLKNKLRGYPPDFKAWVLKKQEHEISCASLCKLVNKHSSASVQ